MSGVPKQILNSSPIAICSQCGGTEFYGGATVRIYPNISKARMDNGKFVVEEIDGWDGPEYDTMEVDQATCEHCGHSWEGDLIEDES